MPKLHTKRKVLDGAAQVISYERDPEAFYYREVSNPGEYRTVRINGVKTEEEAVAKALEIYGQFRSLEAITSTPKVTKVKRVKKASIAISIQEHLKEQKERADAGLVTHEYVSNKVFHLRHLAAYLESKHIKYVMDIVDDTFDDYELFRFGKATKIGVSNEVKTIAQWLNWCRKKRQLQPDVAALKLTPKITIKKEDLLANPPLSEGDWEKVETYIRDEYVGKAGSRDRRGAYWRQCFYTLIMLGRFSGMRPVEMVNLKWSDVAIVSVGDRLIAEINIRKTKNGEPRQVPARCGMQMKEWFEYQQNYVKEYGISRPFNKDSFVFITSDFNDKAYSIQMFSKHIRMIYRSLDLTGHWASDKPYTLYSLRSTFVDAMLMEDTPIAMLSLMTGHSVTVLQKHYSRLDVMRKSRELTQQPTKRKGKQEIQLWD